MDRRKSLKVLAFTSLSGSLLLDACNTDDKKAKQVPPKKEEAPVTIDRMAEEKAAYEKLEKEKFFTPHEMATIATLCDIIIPADEVSGSATDAKVPDFIEFIVKDMPEHQTPLRGGLRWLDVQSAKRYDKSFKDCTQQQQLSLVDEIAYPKKAKPEMKQGVAFFSLMRNLTASGFYSSQIGIKDIAYVGNTPTQWNGVPGDVLKQYGLSYTDKELKECVSF